MDNASLMLRFRDITAGVNTIDEHKAMIFKHGGVWWGWWRKEWESRHEETLERISGSVPTYAILVDSSTERMFRARIDKVAIEKSDIDIELVPGYYRNSVDVSAWFLLGSISPVSYDEHLAALIGNRTLLDLEFLPEQPDTGEQEDYYRPERDIDPHILHLSDLHFGSDHAFRQDSTDNDFSGPQYSLRECLIEDLDRQGLKDKIGILLITGDFTTAGA